jgi:hypothetical protein
MMLPAGAACWAVRVSAEEFSGKTRGSAIGAALEFPAIAAEAVPRRVRRAAPAT